MSFPRLTPDLGNYQSLEFWLDQLIGRRLASLGFINQFGALASRPSATASNVLPGSFYFATDTGVVYQSQNGIWVAITGQTHGVLVSKSASTSIPTATFTKVPFDVEIYKDDSSAHSNSVNNTRLTAPVPGHYLATVDIMWENTVNTGQRLTEIIVNGTTELGRVSQLSSATLGTFIAQHTSATVNLNTGDYVEVQVYEDSGSSINVSSSITGFSLEKL